MRAYAGPEAHYEWGPEPRLTYWSTGVYKLTGKKVSSAAVEQILAASLVDRGPEAHYEWEPDPRLTYFQAGTYKLGSRRISRADANEIMSLSIVDRGPEARWRWYMEPPRIEYLYGPRWTVDGRFVEPDQAQWFIADQLSATGAERLEWAQLKIDPDLSDVSGGIGEVQVEIGTAEIPLEEIEKLYGQMPGGQESDDLTEERPVPFGRVPEDAVEEARHGWANFDVWLADETSFGRWVAQAKGIAVLVAYYLVAHRVVYVEQDVVLWGEVIRTRYAPLGRGDSYLELRARVKDMQEKSDEDVIFVAAGMKVLVRVLV